MKKQLLKNSFLLFSVFILSASCGGREWTKTDTALEAVWQVGHVADWMQTRQVAKHPAQWEELNPILGKHPSVGKVDTYMLGAALAHYGISYALPKEYRGIWQYISITVKYGVVGYNSAIGVSVKW